MRNEPKTERNTQVTNAVLGEKKSFRKTAAEFDISPTRVSQLVQKERMRRRKAKCRQRT